MSLNVQLNWFIECNKFEHFLSASPV